MNVSLEMIYEKSKQIAPFFVEHLDDHKICIEHSATNEMMYPPAKKYPKSRWMIVIATSRIQPQEELIRESKKLSKHFKRLHSTILNPFPDQRWMNYSLNNGESGVIDVWKSYTGDDDTVVIDCINTEMIHLGNEPHGYSLDTTLDKFFHGYYNLVNYTQPVTYSAFNDLPKEDNSKTKMN